MILDPLDHRKVPLLVCTHLGDIEMVGSFKLYLNSVWDRHFFGLSMYIV